jgi:DNA polymerase elongation subunit (family B)
MDPDSQEYKSTFANQWVTKDLANSFYGVLGNKYFREFNINMSEAITVTGQYLLTWVSNYIAKTGRVSVYGDTDSIFAQLKEGENVEDVLKEINSEMTKMLMKDFNVKKSTLELGFDCKFNQFIIESKKKYTGLVDGKLRSRGMELVKRDSIQLAVRSQKELLDLIFTGSNIEKIKEWIVQLKEHVLKGNVKVEDIVIRKRINKDPKTYKSKPLHVILAEAQGHGSGNIVQYVITDGSKKLAGVPLEKFDGSFDRLYYFNSAVFPMLSRVLQVVYPDVNWDEYLVEIPKVKKKQLKLDEFIK